MFTNKKYENGESLRKCFTKCLKIATAAMKDTENLHLLVNILNKYVYFYMADIEQITSADINKLIELIQENIKQIREDGKVERAKKGIKFFENTMNALRLKLKDSPAKFSKINVE